MTVDNESADAIRRWTEAGQRAFLDALAPAYDRWQDEILAPERPDRGVLAALERVWTPGHACVHTLESQWFTTEMAAQVVRRARTVSAPPLLEDRNGWYARRNIDLRSLRNGLRDVARVGAIVEERCAIARDELAGLADSDLDLPFDLGERNVAYVRSFGSEAVPETLRSLLTVNALHLHDHADQIRRAVTGVQAG